MVYKYASGQKDLLDLGNAFCHVNDVLSIRTGVAKVTNITDRTKQYQLG